MSARGIPDQDLPENQDPDVMYTTDQMTGEQTPFGKDGKPVESKKSDAGSDDKPAAKKAAADKKEGGDGSRTSTGDRK